jgi:hypothetical protein
MTRDAATVSDRIAVRVRPAPRVLCAVCKTDLGYMGHRPVFVRPPVSARCPACGRPWLAVVDGIRMIKTNRGFLPCATDTTE